MSSAPELAVVWGATGYVGRQLVRALIASGWRVRALVRDPGAANLVDLAAVDVRGISLRSPRQAMLDALAGADVVYHCAGHGNGSGSALPDFVEGTASFARAAREAGVRRYVQLSTVAVYGAATGIDIGPETPANPRSEYARSRHAAELGALEAFEGALERCTLVRIPMVVGPGMRSDALRALFRVLRFGLFLHPGNRAAVLNCIGENRLAASLVSIATLGAAQVPTICQLADNLPWRDIVATYAEALGRRILRIPMPAAIASLAAIAAAGRRGSSPSVSVLDNRVTFRDQGGKVSAPAPRTLDDIRALALAEVARRRRRFDVRARADG
jgi:nucleoside-diphosphate-sugar epimerase